MDFITYILPFPTKNWLVDARIVAGKGVGTGKGRRGESMKDEQVPMFTAKCRTEQTTGGFRFTFFCAICGAGFTTPFIPGNDQKLALRLAEQEARLHFNRCQRCHLWVCDEHFNENCMLCTTCAPRVCMMCSSAVPKDGQFCVVCGTPQYKTGKERMDTDE